MLYYNSGDVMNYTINMINEASPPHSHNNYEIIVCTKGGGYFNYSGGVIDVVKGTIIIIPPNTVHSSTYKNEYERIYISGNFNNVFNFSSPAVMLDNSEKEGTMLAKIIYRNRYAENDFLSALAVAFAKFLIQNFKHDSAISLAVKEIVSKITDCFHEYNPDLKSILKKSGYAEDYIRAKFKEIMGYTPVEFLTDVRIKHACFLIDMYAGMMPLSEVAERCGFSDYVYFSK